MHALFNELSYENISLFPKIISIIDETNINNDERKKKKKKKRKTEERRVGKKRLQREVGSNVCSSDP